MALLFFQTKLFIPNNCYHSIFDIDYKKYYDKGFRYLLFDIDNTLVSYKEELPTKKQVEMFSMLSDLGFAIAYISNNREYRVRTFASVTDIPYIASAKKPFSSGFKKALRLINCNDVNQALIIGDQLLTDIFGGNRLGLTTILVYALERNTEKWFTKVNRFLEKRILCSIKKIDYKNYQKIVSLGVKNEN